MGNGTSIHVKSVSNNFTHVQSLKKVNLEVHNKQIIGLSAPKYSRHQSLDYIEAKRWRLELGDVAAD
jgi:ABC-type branched-subunit amino acid transport system ATPase component